MILDCIRQVRKHELLKAEKLAGLWPQDEQGSERHHLTDLEGGEGC